MAGSGARVGTSLEHAFGGVTDMYQEFDVVRLKNSIPEYGIDIVAQVVILTVERSPQLHYEVEICDQDGKTLFQGGLLPEDIEDG